MLWGMMLSLLSGIGLNPVPFLADTIGSTEPALKLLISIFMSYPLAIVYHTYIRKHSEQYRNLYFIVTGLDMALYNYGLSIYHNIIPVIVIHFTTKVLSSKINAIFSFVFNMCYLVIGYIMTESDEYDITWTMPHCVLTLKLIALGFDLWDGQREPTSLSANSLKTALKTPPTFMELLGFVYFSPCFLVGPMFCFIRYKRFISDPQFSQILDKEAAVYENYAFKRLLQGVAYLVAFQVGGIVFSTNYMLSDKFTERSILYRHFFCGLWAHFALYKYISCWLLTEASCIRFGFSHNPESKSQWDGCTNIKLMRFESATKFQHYIDSFNCNTNYFAAEYVYKRLKFLGNRFMSQILTMLFLAVWHGTQSGYYATFFNEFIIMVTEKDLEPMLVKTKLYHTIWNHPAGKVLLYIILKTYTIVFMGWSLVPIALKTFPRWWQVYRSLWFSGYLLFLLWPFVYKPIFKRVITKLEPFSEKDKAQ